MNKTFIRRKGELKDDMMTMERGEVWKPLENDDDIYDQCLSSDDHSGKQYPPCWILGEWNTETRCSLLMGGPGRSDKVKSIYKVGASVIFLGYSMH